MVQALGTWHIRKGRKFKATDITLWRELEFKTIPEDEEFYGTSLGDR